MKIDDMDYVVAHPLVSRGLTWMGFVYAFVGMHAVNWHPLTTISHMVDCQVFGVAPAGPHLVNAVFHSLNAALLFWVLRKLTGSTWRSIIVATLFAIHPLRVESVAWISERKDVLSAFFFLLTIWSYGAYVEKLKQRASHRSQYVLTLVLFLFAVLSKPMVVTLPFVLLLLDFWPLHRIDDKLGSISIKHLLWEKVPFFVLSAALSYITFRVQHAEGATTSLEALPISVRLPHVVVSYVVYLEKIFWPTNLALVYPYETALRWQMLAASSTLLAAILILAWRGRKFLPALFVGLLWFLGMLVPVIGLVQVGEQANADRYTYLPCIGILVGLVWSVGWISQRLISSPVCRQSVVAIIVCGLAVGLAIVTRIQISYWRDDETLMRHSIEAAGPTELTRRALGSTLIDKGNLKEGIEQLQLALKIDPNSYGASSSLAVAYAADGKLSEAEHLFRTLLASRPTPTGHFQLADFLQAQGRLDEARVHYQEGLAEMPYSALAHNNLGNNYSMQHNWEAARQEYERALKDNPRCAEAHNNFGTLLMINGNAQDALAHWEEAVRLRPDWVEPLNNLAWSRATHPDSRFRNGSEAVILAQKAVQLSRSKDPQHLDTLAAAYAENGMFDDAIRTAQTALTLGAGSTNASLSGAIREHLALYEQRKPFRELAR